MLPRRARRLRRTGGRTRYVPETERKSRFELKDLLRLCYPPTLSVVFRREVLTSVPDWAFEVPWTDWLIWVFATRRGPFAYLDEVMGVYRVHEGGYFSSQDRTSQLEEDLREYRRLLDELPEQATSSNAASRPQLQLAAEDFGLPYDSPVVVAGDFADLLLHLNGREVRRLDARGKDVRTTIEDLESLCAQPGGRTTPVGGPASRSETLEAGKPLLRGRGRRAWPAAAMRSPRTSAESGR